MGQVLDEWEIGGLLGTRVPGSCIRRSQTTPVLSTIEDPPGSSRFRDCFGDGWVTWTRLGLSDFRPYRSSGSGRLDRCELRINFFEDISVRGFRERFALGGVPPKGADPHTSGVRRTW